MVYVNKESSQRFPVNQPAPQSDITDGSVPDFRLHKHSDGGWQLHVVSTRASYWLRANHTELCEPANKMDILRANAFLREARKAGLKTEYIGPNGSDLL